jgi:ATP-dependent DNA helicase DinG
MLRSVPDAAMVLAQGAGRLIRSMTDRGAVACLDGRILKSAPGWRLLRRALPGFPTSYTVDDVSRLLAGEELHGVPVVRAKSNRLRWS